MPIFRQRISQSTLTWILTVLALAAMLPTLLLPATAQAELRAFRLKITNSESGTERQVVTRFDHEQYPMYVYVSPKESITIDQTWMCYPRNDYVGTLCPAPAPSQAPNASGGPARQTRTAPSAPSSAAPSAQDRSPASVVPPKR